MAKICHKQITGGIMSILYLWRDIITFGSGYGLNLLSSRNIHLPTQGFISITLCEKEIFIG